MNNLTGSDNRFFKFAFWALGLAAAFMWLNVKDLLLNLLSIVVAAVMVFAVADMVLIGIGALSDPAQGFQARIATWIESMRAPAPAPAPKAAAQRPAPQTPEPAQTATRATT